MLQWLLSITFPNQYGRGNMNSLHLTKKTGSGKGEKSMDVTSMIVSEKNKSNQLKITVETIKEPSVHTCFRSICLRRCPSTIPDSMDNAALERYDDDAHQFMPMKDSFNVISLEYFNSQSL